MGVTGLEEPTWGVEGAMTTCARTAPIPARNEPVISAINKPFIFICVHFSWSILIKLPAYTEDIRKTRLIVWEMYWRGQSVMSRLTASRSEFSLNELKHWK
jgi:hypothetical protein